MSKIQLFGYEELLNSIVNSVKLFRDPLEDDTPLLYDNNVYDSFPGKKRIGLYSGVMAVVSLQEIPTITGVGEKVATFTGELYTSIPGNDSDSVKKCLRYCDITRGYFESNNLLDLTGTFTKVNENYPNRFVGLDMSKVFGTKQPVHVRTGLTAFIVEKDLDDTVYTLE